MVTSILGQAHNRFVFERRVRVLTETLGAHVPGGSTLLDVGTGDGQIALQIARRQPDTFVEGIDVMLRPETHIPVSLFDGTHIPFEDDSFDVVSFVDVLHHTDDAKALVAEAARVARKAVLIKDHLSENFVDHAILRLMDWVGNAPHGVVLPYNYASRAEWMSWFDAASLEIDSFETSVPLYPFPLNMIFGRKLHFVARLTPLA